ncbi:hypothetical protein ABVT39_004874 [Epinephelus coioides]
MSHSRVQSSRSTCLQRAKMNKKNGSTTETIQIFTDTGPDATAESKSNLTVSDGHAAYKCTLYKELAAQVQVGKSYIFKEYSTAKFGDQSLLCTPTTKIYMCADVLVPEELEEEARILIRPPSPMTSLSDMTVPSDYMTVQGSITRLDPVQAVTPAQGQPYPMRSLYLKELFSGLVDIEVLGVSVQKEDIEFLDTKEKVCGPPHLTGLQSLQWAQRSPCATQMEEYRRPFQ